MKDYIVRTENGVSCTHPQVEKFFEWGGVMGIEKLGPISHNATIILKDESRHDFGGTQEIEKTMTECKEFLNALPE
jgi:hypothetical protein